MSVQRVFLIIAAAVALLSWSIRPAKLNFNEDTSQLLVGTEINTPPFLRFINWIGHPFRRFLVPLDAEAIKQKAIDSFGDEDMTDFGEFVHWDSYEKYVEVVDTKCHLLGRFMMSEILHKYLRTHLWMTKQLNNHPEIRNEVIEKPIFFGSFTRVGATFMLQVLADTYPNDLIAQKQYEMMSTIFKMEGDDTGMSRIEQTDLSIKMLNYLNPVLSMLHEWTTPEDIEEEAGYYAYTFCGLAASFTFPSPYHSFLFSGKSCKERHHPFLKTILQIQQWQQGSERKARFVLKSPEHLHSLEQLYRVFPDASVIVLDRTDINRKFISSMAITHHCRQLFVNPRLNDTLFYNEILSCEELEAIDFAVNGTFDVIRLQSPQFFKSTFSDLAQVAGFVGLPWDEKTQMHAKKVIQNRLRWKIATSVYKMDEFGLSEKIIREKLSRCQQRPRTYEEWLEKYSPSEPWEL